MLQKSHLKFCIYFPIFDNLEKKTKLKQARLNIIDYITRVWYDDNIITPSIISNGFKKAGLINNVYTTSEEDKINPNLLEKI